MEKRARYTSSRSQSCINVALRFVSPENVGECIRLTEERRKLPQGHVAKDDKLEVKKMVLHSMMEAIIDLGAIRRNNSKMDSVKSLSSTSSSTPVNKVGDAMPQATQQRSLDIVRQSADMAQARRKSSAIENELAMPQATPPTSLDIVGQSEDMPLGRMKISSAIENEMVRTPQADCRSPVSSHLFSTTRSMLQATSSTFSDTVGQLEDMAPAGRKICSAIEDELVRTAQADCRSLVSSRHLSAEKAMPQLTPSTSSDTVRQSEDMAPAGRKICSSIEDELAKPQATPPVSSDVVGQSENMAPARRKISSATKNKVVRTAQADCPSPVSSLLSAKNIAMLQPTPPASSDIVGWIEDMAPARRKIFSPKENATTPQADYRSPICGHFLSLEEDRPEESTSVPNLKRTPIIRDVNSTFNKVESFLKSIPEELFLPLSGHNSLKYWALAHLSYLDNLDKGDILTQTER